MPNDGCDDDCTFTCTTDFDCQNGNACDGSETCDTANHICMPATTALDCNDSNDCTTDTCDMTTGCTNTSVEVDADHDGHAMMGGSCGGDDCDDTNAARYPGAPEPCGSSTDLNCDGNAGTMPTFYRDCDGDNYAASTSGAVTACTEPAAVSGCTGGWTTTMPISTSTTDCLDTSLGATAHPGQSMYYDTPLSGLSPSYDYNCSGTQTNEYPFSSSATVPPTHVSSACSGIGRLCTGAIWYVRSTAPTCGSSVTISYCTGLTTCARTTRTGVVVACH
jgi:hypothetical protein